MRPQQREPENTSNYTLGEQYCASRQECLLKKKKKEVFRPHYIFKVIHQCCLLLFTVNDWEYAFNRNTEKHTKPRFALEQRGAAACISASIHCFITAASRCFGPPFFHNLEMVLNVQMQMLLTILSLPLAAIHSFCQKYAEKQLHTLTSMLFKLSPLCAVLTCAKHSGFVGFFLLLIKSFILMNVLLQRSSESGKC